MSQQVPAALRPGRAVDSSSSNQPHPPSYLKPTATSTSGSSPGGSSPTSSPAVLTLDALLEAHATAPSPTHAALEATIAERNLLTAQNAQLWKLIEKQRTGYSGMVKDLDRIRAERDAYRNRLHAVGESTEGLVRKERERAKAKANVTKASTSTTAFAQSGRDSPDDPRRGMVRHQSDDHVGKGRRMEGSPARRAPASRNQSGDDAHAHCAPADSTTHGDNKSRSVPSSRSNAAPTISEQPHRASPPPLVIPGRSDSLSGNAPALQVPETTTLSKMNGTPIGSPNTAGPSPLSQFPLPPGAGVSFGGDGERNASRPHTDVAGGQSAVPISLGVPTQHVQTLSRESRVELPDEAKRYIANMADSPATSSQTQAAPFQPPHMHVEERGAETTRPANAMNGGDTWRELQETVGRKGAPQREARRAGQDAEFIDMDEEDSPTGASGRATPDSHVSAAPSSVDPVMTAPGASQPPRRKSSLVQPQNHASNSSFPAASVKSTASATSQPSGSETQSGYTSTTPSADTSRIDLPLRTESDHGSTAIQELNKAVEPVGGPQPSFRELPLLPTDLPNTQIVVCSSTIKPNDRGKDVLSFIIAVEPGAGKGGWKIEKLYSDVLGLDHRVRSTIGKTAAKKIATLPEGRLWRDHAPSRVDQRKAALEAYITSLILLPVKNKDETIAFLTSDILRSSAQPVYQAGYKEGYLTKRGKNFGGWKTRYFVLNGPKLDYYESRGGTHLGSISITGAQIGRQQRSSRNSGDDDNEYRHAFLVIEAKKGPGGSQVRHVLCAETDTDRDGWVNVLVRYVGGSYSEEASTPATSASASAPSVSKSSVSLDEEVSPVRKMPTRGMSKDNFIVGSAVPISQLAPDASNAKLMQAAPYPESLTAPSSNGAEPGDTERHSPTKVYSESNAAKRMFESSNPGSLDAPLSTSLPTSSPLDGPDAPNTKRSASELGWYPDAPNKTSAQLTAEAPRAVERQAHRKSYHPNLNPVKGSPTGDRPSTPENAPAAPTPQRNDGKTKISGPMGGVPIPSGFKFGSKDPVPTELAATSPSNDRREKAKSRSFWGFGGRNNATSGPSAERAPVPAMASAPVFGVPVEESLAIAEIAGLPAIAFRCIQYLEAKKADQEEGIYRLSGSSAVIKALKDRFNTEGDVDLFASDEFWDPHAIAGLLKTFFRDLPASILTRELHLRFLAVIDFVDPEDRIRELAQLIAQLPVANYSLLRALTAHLIRIVQNAHVNKMTMRNVGIVFSPTLGIPAGVFSLMLGEFKRVFSVEEDEVEAPPPEAGDGEATPMMDRPIGLDRRNSKRYTDAAADKLLGLAGRTLATPEEDDDSDIEISVQGEDSGTETNETYEPSVTESHHETPQSTPAGKGRAASAAANRGLNIATSNEPKKRQSRVPIGLPASPRPGFHPSTFAQQQTPGTSPPVSPNPARLGV